MEQCATVWPVPERLGASGTPAAGRQSRLRMRLKPSPVGETVPSAKKAILKFFVLDSRTGASQPPAQAFLLEEAAAAESVFLVNAILSLPGDSIVDTGCRTL